MADEQQIDIIAQQTPPVFGNRGPGIFGVKFNDLNGNGIRESNEPGLANVTFILEPAATANGTFNAGVAGEAVVTSGTNGVFQFLNVAPGNYRITEQVPSGAFATTPNPLPVTVSNTDVNVLFGNSTTPASGIVGCKYLDLDGDGFRDGNEPGIKNVRIYIDANNNGIFDTNEQSTFSDRNGNWRLNVSAGTYRIREERVNGLTTEPLERDFPQSTPPNNVPLLDVTVKAGETFSCAQVGNAPLYQIPVEKFRDLDGNGRRNTVTNVNGFTGQEPPIARVPFIIDLNRDGRWQTDEPILITDANGQGVFRDLPAGNYSVLEIFPTTLPSVVGGGVPGNFNAPIGSTPNPIQVSAPGTGSRFQGSINEAAPLRVTDTSYTRTGANIDDPIVPAGQRPIFVKETFTLPPRNPQPSVTFSPVAVNPGQTGGGAVGNTRPNINVFKYNDQNGNGIYEPNRNETPVSGVTVFIDLNGDGQFQAGTEESRITNADGRAAFTNLPAGSYAVAEVVPTGFAASNPARVQFNLGTQDANVIFGNTPNSRITGCKFEDLNQNGYRDGNEPGIQGTTIYIDTNGDGRFQSTEPSTVSAADGTWSFNNLTPGTYRVREVAPAGFFQTTQPLDIILGANQEFGCALIGNARRYDLRVPKFRDDNRDGVQNNGEPPLVGIPFTLDLNRNGRYDAGTEPLSRSDSNGIALFTDLFPGTYSVLEVFGDPSVTNPFPIPTGPNPVNFLVPGPNTVPSPPRASNTTTQATSGTLDPLTDGGLLATQPTSDAASFITGDAAVSSLPVVTNTEDSLSSLSIVAQDPLIDDQKLLLAAPAPSPLF
ncbi:hypothetical protein BCD67_04715 [Oscillatoriales cyanobacterium USR001]|nr:hypothetical protein BCD67_04715 [Oscillatoriales cyanobacterium USR001]